MDTNTLPENLPEAIEQLKKEKNAVILGHYYQHSDIQDISDYVGDSLGLSQEAAKTDADIILFAGVVFMAETAKILSPDKKVLVPDLEAGCSLADECPAAELEAFIKQHPGHTVVSYVNCSVEVKALSDILCTSSNALKIIESIPKDTPILFAPDRHLGSYLKKLTGRKMVLWHGSCMVHDTFDAREIVRLQARNSNAVIIAHPECPESVLSHADHIGSTSSLLNFVKTSEEQEFIVATEPGIIYQMKKAAPDKIFHEAPASPDCACNECHFMKLNTMKKLYMALLNEQPEITVSPAIREKALIPLNRMLSLS